MMRRARGFTLVEVMIALAVLAIAIIGLIATYVWMSRQAAVNAETTRAMRAAEQAIESMYGNTPFTDIFRRYNSHLGDEAAIPTYPFPYPSAPQACTFEVLSDGQIVFGAAPPATPLMFVGVGGNRVGRIEFPEGNIISGVMRLDENACVAMGFSGNQCDVDANGVYTDVDVLNYVLLPVRVTLTFQSIGGGERTITYRKLLVSR